MSCELGMGDLKLGWKCSSSSLVEVSSTMRRARLSRVLVLFEFSNTSLIALLSCCPVY